LTQMTSDDSERRFVVLSLVRILLDNAAIGKHDRAG